MQVRAARADEAQALAAIWHDGWMDAHAAIVPPALVRMRTPESFLARMTAAVAGARVLGDPAVGFHLLRDDELDQFYLAAAARGTGAAQVLIADAERQLLARGVTAPWLTCTVGNHRAARFYETCGWRRAGAFTTLTPTDEGEVAVEAWRYEKTLG